MTKVLLTAVLLCSAAVARAGEPAKEANGLPLVFHEDFRDADKALARFAFTDPATWKIAPDGGKNVLSLHALSKIEPPVRSPYGRALVKDLWVGPFVMEAKLRSTVPDQPRRDMCLLFGAVDDTHFYYAHLAKTPDAAHENVFIVNGTPRKNLIPPPAAGVTWDDGYHTAKLTRDAAGAIEVFFDGKSVMKAADNTFPVGRVGVGSFDDLGNVAEITVWGKTASKPEAPKTQPKK